MLIDFTKGEEPLVALQTTKFAIQSARSALNSIEQIGRSRIEDRAHARLGGREERHHRDAGLAVLGAFCRRSARARARARYHIVEVSSVLPISN